MKMERIISSVMSELERSSAHEADDYMLCESFEISSHLEHSLISPYVTEAFVCEECSVARRYCIAAVCVSPYYVAIAKNCLSGSSVAVSTVIGFPHCGMSAAGKVAEVRECIKNGASHIDATFNIQAVKSGNMADARAELEAVMDVARGKATVKVLFEPDFYNEEEKCTVLQLAKLCGVPYVTLCNSKGSIDSMIADIKHVREIIGTGIKIKVNADIRTIDEAQELICAGADRIGIFRSAISQ